ncbi:MAG: hypothetical protein CSA75_01435 [Sorangium cellulosum]|nr:MAG: hypothetical protein CSA75_01435 [Sorangium cellulosum]
MAPSPNPPSSIPATVPKRSSGGPYIAAIVVLVLLIVGLVWYKFSDNKEPASQPPVIQSVTQNNHQPFPVLDIPPPPELDAAVDAASDAKKKTKVGVGRGLCSSPCNGNVSSALRAALSGNAGAARGCYERALRTNAMLQGRMMVAVRISSNGSVCSASIAQDSVGSPQVASCVLGLFRGKHFPAVTGGRCADVQVPLSFTPRENK